MCGIIGAFRHEGASSIVGAGLERIKERGTDGYGLFDGKEGHHAASPKSLPGSGSRNILGHALHAIVHTVPQPLRYGGAVLSANCEIYNWEELAQKHGIRARNDAELLLRLLRKEGLKKTLPQLRGVYAFAYWEKETVYVARDLIGIKPLWYSLDEGLAFCSEKKGLFSSLATEELNPRKILRFDLKTGKASFLQRAFPRPEESTSQERTALRKLDKTFAEAIKLRIPERKFGLFFSGGLDSALVASYLKEHSPSEFVCYVAGTDEVAPDVMRARETAETLGLRLKVVTMAGEEAEGILKELIPLIEDSNVIKAGVALPLYIAAKEAKKDGCKVIFSGSGADELFGGYHRYRSSALNQLNKDCYSDILKFYERNSYRDDVLTMNNNLELRVPFLDRKLVRFGLGLDPSLKIKDDDGKQTEKWILRQLAKSRGIPARLADAPKKAAQYGSGFDKLLGKLAKRAGHSSKSSYLNSFLRRPNLNLGALISSGKDSWYAAHVMARQNYDITCMISLESRNPDSYMFHTPAIEMVRMQSEASGIPLVYAKTAGEKEQELKDLRAALGEAKKKHGIQGVCTGALYSNYQRERIEKVCDCLGLKMFSPLWHMEQEQELRSILKEDFTIILTKIAADGLDKGWLGKPLSQQDVDKLVRLNKKIGFNIAGEGGEFESLVLDCPFFSKKIRIEESQIMEESENTAYLLIKKSSLIPKENKHIFKQKAR